jgi:hypothetical protein
MRRQSEKTTILRTRAETVKGFQEPASESQIITVEPGAACGAVRCHSRWRVAPFHFSSRAENYKRAATANMNGHFIDRFVRSSDIGRAEIVAPKVTRMRASQRQATGDVRKRMARRCFSAATGACR